MDDKEILYQMLDRYINNIIIQLVPALSPFSPAVSRMVKSTIDPYVTAFMGGTDSINSEAAGEFLKTEVSDKIDSFLKEFNAKRDAL